MKIQESYENAYILMHPLRRRIVDELSKNKEAYTASIAKTLDMSDKERLIGFHMTILAQNGFVEGEFRLANPITPPKVVKYYHLTEKAVSTLKQITKELPQ